MHCQSGAGAILYRVSEDADAFDFDLDHIALFHGADTMRGAGHDDVTGVQGHAVCQETDEERNAEDQALGGF